MSTIRAAGRCTSATKRPRSISRAREAEFTDEELKATLADIEGLKDAGLLYAEEAKVAPVKSHELKALCIHICHDCNLRCKYCFADEGAYHAAREMMRLETAKKAIDFLIANSGARKVLEVDFFGGEPLMNLDVIKETVSPMPRKRRQSAASAFCSRPRPTGFCSTTTPSTFSTARWRTSCFPWTEERKCMTPCARQSRKGQF